MRIHTALVATIAAVLLGSCSADRLGAPEPLPTPVPLKDFVADGLPSPYYHFEYDTTGRVTKASFASQLVSYDVIYEGSRIAEMRYGGAAGRDRLVYGYDARGRVSTITYRDDTDAVFTTVSLTYDGTKLTRLVRNRMLAGNFVLDKTTTFSYYADGNLRDLTEHRPAIEGFQTDVTITDHYDQYDDAVNVDAFDLLHDDFFDHLILLPAVQLQRGNPRRVVRTGDAGNYTVDYTYSYDASNRPLTKAGSLTFSTGTNAGKTFAIRTTFSYC